MDKPRTTKTIRRMTNDQRKELIDQIRNDWQHGVIPMYAIAVKHNVTLSFTRKMCADIPDRKRDTPQFTPVNPKPRSKYSAALWRNRARKPEILVALRQGYTVGHLSIMFGITPKTIHYWRANDPHPPTTCYCGMPYAHRGPHAKRSVMRKEWT